jgi:thiol-disulfide isomerase/thioredoxin
MRRVVAAIPLLAGALLVLAFVRALPAAVERERAGRDNAVRAVCEPALRPEPHSPALGALPADAPDFTLRDYAGREMTLSSLRGRVVLVNFWATWCPTCVVEMPSLEKLAAAEKGRPFSLLAVSVDESWDVVRRFFAGGSALTVLLDKDRGVPARYGTEKFPESFLIDRDGRVRYFVVSDRDWSTPEAIACIDALLSN